jgi:hypothetical protein
VPLHGRLGRARERARRVGAVLPNAKKCRPPVSERVLGNQERTVYSERVRIIGDGGDPVWGIPGIMDALMLLLGREIHKISRLFKRRCL